MKDPTHQEMFDYLARQCAGSEDIRFDIEEAIYWFAYSYHGGQWSNLYEALCQSEFHPSPLANAPDDSMLLDMLVEEFGQ